MSNLKRYTLYILNIFDLLAILLSYYPAYFLAFSSLFREKDIFGTINFSRYVQFLLIVIVAYAVISIMAMYNDDQFLNRKASEELMVCAKLTGSVMILVLLFFYMAKISVLYSRLFIGFYSLVLFFMDFLLRTAAKKIVLPRLQKGSMAEKIIIMTSRDRMEQMILSMKDAHDWRYQIVGAVVTDSDDKGARILDVPVIADDADAVSDYLDTEFDAVLYDPGYNSEEKVQKTMQELHQFGKTIHLKMHQYHLENSYVTLDSMGASAVMSYKPVQPMAKRKALVKRILEILCGLTILPILLLCMATMAICNRMFSRGPLFTRHLRIGRNGSRFYLLRFRIMHLDAEERIMKGEDPETTLGRLYRSLHIDGMPQLLNLFSREMSLVGPKAPSIGEYLEMYPEERANYVVRPGIIGYWSIDGDPDEASLKFHEEINTWSLLKDITVILTAVGKYLIGRSLRSKCTNYELESITECSRMRLDTLPLIYEHTGNVPQANPLYLLIKRVADIIISLAGILALSPIMLLLTLLVIADDGGAPFYSHARIGRNGKRIHVYKFRSMRRNAGDLEKYLTSAQLEQYRREFKIDDDPRITGIGNFLRHTSLDELPQLFNILGGSLSIIGPRPIVEKETEYYADQLEKFLSVKPGLTGYWQAYARNNATYESGERQRMEMYYVEHRSLWMDIKIFFKTIGTVVSGDGAQ